MSEVEQRLRSAEVKISKNSYETAIIFDMDGNVILEREGSEDEVPFTEEELSRFEGCIFTHNHTYNKHLKGLGIENTSSFSSDDLMLAYQRNLQQVRMVIGNELHTFRWSNPDKRQAERFLYQYEELDTELNIHINTAREKAEEAVVRAEHNSTDHNRDIAIRATTAYYREQKKQADKLNSFIESNQHIGYIYRKERLL